MDRTSNTERVGDGELIYIYIYIKELSRKAGFEFKEAKKILTRTHGMHDAAGRRPGDCSIFFRQRPSA